MKKIGVKSLLNVLYATIILLPMFSIFGRLIYTQANPNAKDSYYGETINQEKLNPITNITQFELNKNYIFDSNNFTYMDSGNVGAYARGITISNFKLLSITNFSLQIDNPTFFGLYIGSSQLSMKISNDTDSQTVYFNGNKIVFQFTYISNSLNYNFAETKIFTKIEYNNYSYLDNAFEYSIKTFTDDNNFGNVDFFGWFTNLFLNQSSTKNALYLNFVNWYLNYTLLVSSGYLLFLALIWFINYVRKILDKSMYHDFGGY